MKKHSERHKKPLPDEWHDLARIYAERTGQSETDYYHSLGENDVDWNKDSES